MDFAGLVGTPGPDLDILAPLGHLAMLAMAFLAVVTAERDRTPPPPAGMIPFTLNEIRRLFDALTTAPATTAEHVLNWSTWRRNTKPSPENAIIAADQSTTDPELPLPY